VTALETRRPESTPVAVRHSLPAARLSALVAALAVVAALTGLLWSGGSAPDSVTSVHGEQVELWGEGLYRHDSVFKAAANRGTDLVTLLLAVPLLALAMRRYRRPTLAGALALAGVLAWFLYLYASLALGTAYNGLFLLYVVAMAASLWGIALIARGIDARALPRGLADRVPRRALAALLLVSAVLTSFVWVEPLLSAAAAGEPPHLLLHATTTVTEALDLGVIVPAAAVAAALILRRRVEGLLLGVPLLVLLWLLAPAIVAQTVFQLRAGWEFTTPEVVGPIGGFLVLGAVTTALLVPTLRRLQDAR
jgi:hypothetical protein